MKFYTSAISALVIAALAIFVNEFADRFDQELNACGLGTYTDGGCVCKHPYVGKHCEVVDCGYGRLINSLFESNLITTPNPDSDLGCACESKFWGFGCANCTSKYPSDCSGPCLDAYYGARCDVLCKESTAADAEGVAHEAAGGIYNFYVENQGICLNDGSVRCNPGRAGSHCEFQCLDCEYGSCNLNDGSCNCFAGYYGDLCNATCPGRCSGNNGLCQDDGTCNCDAGFTGDDCSLECCVRDAGTAIGRVHGSCDPTGGCLCDDGWTGPNCDCNDRFTCSNRGTCSNVTGTCVCEDQFQGARCEMCDDLRIGAFCEYDRYQCPSREQQNGEFVAINTRGDYRCKCNAGFRGSTCEECTTFAYPKNGTEMCSFVIPASLCNRGKVKPTYQGTGLMCNCEQNFDPATDCASCKTHYFGKDCQIECGVLCTNSGGICESSGCTCPKGKSSVDGVCEFCGGDTDCQNGDCENGRCQCDPGFYGDDCSISAPSFENKVCNGYQSDIYFETAECETDAECLDLSEDAPLENRQVAYRAQQYQREEQTFCHRLDTPIELKNTVGCCVDANADGFCDAANLLDDETSCTGEMVYDICNQRSLEGEVNIFDWCTSQSLGCTMNGECVDPDLCENRCDAGFNSSEWIERWEVDHSLSMESVMNESWKFPIHFEDPYTVRDFYIGASLDDVCPAPTGYNFCRDALIPPDASVFNATHKYVDGWEPMPSFHSCELQHHVIKKVNGTFLYNFSTPIWAGRIEMVSDSTRSAAFGRLGQNNESYYGETNHYIDSLLLFGSGDVEVIIFNYTTDSCVDLMKRSASNFVQCREYAFYEFEYDWDDFCTWRDTVVGPGGFEQRCYDQSLVCAGCEFYQPGCENLPLVSEYPFPMPDPCTPWSNTFCDDFLNISFRQTGTCAYTECDCEGYGVGGPACSLQCAVPQFTNSDSACGSGLDPPWGRCESDRGAIAFGFEQGKCNCFNGGDPNLGCAIVCTNNDECSQDIDTPFSFEAFNCSEYADLVSFEPLDNPTTLLRELCHVNLRDSTCNYWRGRCECATPYTIFTLLNQTEYYNMGSYRVALMQGYEIDEYQPFTNYIPPTPSMLEVVNEDTLCWDPFKYPVTDSFVCESDYAYKNTDTTFDEDQMRCKDYQLEDCGKIRNSSIVPSRSPCGSDILDQALCMANEEYIANVVTKTKRFRYFSTELGACKPVLEICENAQKPMYSWTEYRADDEEFTHPRDPGGRLYVGCDSARFGRPYNAAVCGGGSATVIPQTDALNEFFTSCCKSVGASCRPKDVVTDIDPFLRVNTGFCDYYEGYEAITSIEECEAAVNLMNLYGDEATFQSPVQDVGSVFMGVRGCYYENANVYFNSYPGVSYKEEVQQPDTKTLVCKRKNSIMGAQAVMSRLTCEDGCAAVSYADTGYSSRLSETGGGDGNIMQDCLMYQDNAQYNQDKLLVGDSTNYIVWDLEGEQATFGFELTTDLVNIRPNVYASNLYETKTVIVALYELNSDVSLDLAANGDWQFVEDFEFEMKADKPPILTVDDVEYVAGEERTYRTYNMKWMQGSCGTTMPGTWFAMDGASNMEFHSPNTAQWCTNYCDSLGATHFTLNQIKLVATCSCSNSCSSFTFNSVFYQYETKFASYEIVDKVIPAKNRVELQGEWYSEDDTPRIGSGKRIRKTQFEEWDALECRNWDYIYAKPPRCERAMTREECIGALTPTQQCNQFKDGICTIHCTTNGTDCCGGEHEPADPSWAGSFHISFDPFLYGTSGFLWQPEYESCSDVPSYVFVDDVMCSGDYPDYSMVVNFLPGPNDNWYDVSRNTRALGEHFMLEPTHPLFREDKKEECALRCKQIGATEFAILYKWQQTEHPEERCKCNDREACANVGPWPGTSGTGYYHPVNYYYNSAPYTRAETYVIVDDCTPVEAVTFSCPEDYAEIRSDLDPFDDVYHYYVDRATGIYNAHQWGLLHSLPKHENADGYFKLFSHNVPHLMTEKCAYRQRIEINAYKTRYLKFRASDLSGDYLHDSVQVRPLVTAADVVISDEKSGCIEDNHVVSFYDNPTNLTRVRYACIFSVLATDEICTNGVLSGSGMSAVMCSIMCGSAFHIQNQDCYCAPFDCTVRSPLAGAVSYRWETDHCAHDFLAHATCFNTVSATASNFHECKDSCLNLGHTSWTVDPASDTTCFCCTDDAQDLNYGTGFHTYRLKADMQIPENFVMITDKSCEYYGHTTIMDEELCKRAANEFGGNPTNIFENNVNAHCWNFAQWQETGAIESFSDVSSVLDCAKRCDKFTVEYTDTWASVTCGLLVNLLYEHAAADLNECKTMCSSDVECNYIRYTGGQCNFYSDCAPGGFSAYERQRSYGCSCNNLDSDCDFTNGDGISVGGTGPKGFFTGSNGVDFVSRGCSLNAFTDEDVQIECENCICLEGDSVVTPQFVEVTAGTCESNGYTPIGLRSRCFEAISELGYEMGTLPVSYFGTTSNDPSAEGTPLGCSYNDRPYFGDGATDCSATQKCICQRKSLYKEVTGTCASNNLYGIKTLHDCLAAGIEVKGTSSYVTGQSANYYGCWYDSGSANFITVTNYIWGSVMPTEGNLPAGFSGTVLCRTESYWSNDYFVIWDYQSPITEACADHNWDPIGTQEDCERAINSMGLSKKGLHPVGTGAFADLSAFQADVEQGCRYYISGLAQYSTTGSGDCNWWRPCFCRRPSNNHMNTKELKEYFPLLDIQPYVISVESKYEIFPSGASCGAGYSQIGDAECTDAKPLFSVLKYEADCSRICKPDVAECENDEICHCISDTPITVFDSNKSCAVCGGGEQFLVRSSFFNENGNERSCIHSEDITCGTESTGWTQYRMNPEYRDNETYTKIFSGYCLNSIDVPGDYSSMLMSEVIEHCHRLCTSRSFFAVNRNGCKCTDYCEDPYEPEFWDAFAYISKPSPVELDRPTFLTLWENRDVNIECYKDLEHTQWVECEWIRALKHFARGASYRVGDCDHIGPGVGEGVESQIPCSGHGFLSAGTCACDYAEQLDLKDTGVGMTFELPTLTQTPFRGRGCEQMCPGYDLLNMESVCSGHGRCESDGRCACDQGYAGFKCHLECEKDASDLTCSGHGVCNIIHQPIRPDIESAILALDCNRSEPELLYLARDRVIQTDDSIFHMYMEEFDLLVDIYNIRVSTIITFTGATATSYVVSMENGEIKNTPEIRVCRLTTIVRDFEGYPIDIIDENGNFVAHAWNITDQLTLTASSGTYTYYSTENPSVSGKLIIEDCPDKVTRNSTIDDFYIRGTAVRQPWNTDSKFPYMACADTISVKREEAVHPLLAATSEDVYINCTLLSGMLGTAYTVVCAECACSYSRAAGHWTGYNCRTPALGFLGEDGKTSCPGMVNKVPCNGRGTCNWGSVDGLGTQIRVAANCFCGNPGSDTNYSIAPRNEAGDIVLHAENFGTPLYVDAVDKIEGSPTACPEGTLPLEPEECDFVKEGTLVTIGATITTDQEYTLDDVECAGFDSKTSTAVINRILASGDLVIEGLNQPFKCAAACFGHYRFKANGKIGTSTGVMFETLSGTFEENVQTCGFACMNRDREPITGTFTGFSLMGFSVNEEGKCFCETNGPVILDSAWRYYEYVIPYKEIDDGGRCLLNNVLVYDNTNPSVEPNPGQTPNERIEMCAKKCQLYRHLSDAVGFSYMETNAQCYCETQGNDCTLYNSNFRRFDFTLFNTFKLDEDTECKCGRNGGSECFTSLALPDVFPDVYTFAEPTTEYNNFVCRSNGLYMCKPGEFILQNYMNDCECKFGFTGPLCETPRMMCIFGGQETDGTICNCDIDGVESLKNNPRGCCAYGMFWDQDRYQSFTPLQTFTGVPDNIFYKDALNTVCKPPPFDSMQSPGDNTEERQHNYVVGTTDYEILGTVPCNNQKQVSLYRAKYKYSAADDEYYTSFGPDLFIWADNTLAYFSDHNAKMQCLDHCTIDWVPSDAIQPKGFFLKTFHIGNTDTTNFVGEPNNIPWAFKCSCRARQAYLDENGMVENPSLAQPHLKLSRTVKPQYEEVVDKKCEGNGIHLRSVKYASGIVDVDNCVLDTGAPWGTAPTGSTYRYQGHQVGLSSAQGIPAVKLDCGTRCSKEGFETFWIATYNNYEFCQCYDALDTGESPTGLATQQTCNVHNAIDRAKACLKTCYMAGHRYLNWNTGYQDMTCQCHDTCTEVTHNGHNYFELRPSDVFSWSINGDDSWDVPRTSLVNDVYDILYPKGTTNLECFQSEIEVLEHVDVLGLDRIADNDGNINEIGVPFSLQPMKLNIKAVHAEILGNTPNQVENFQQCLTFCSQQRDQNNRINSVAFTPTFKTIEMVYAGETPGVDLPRCWGPCTSDSDCSGDLVCTNRNSFNNPVIAMGVYGCKEPQKTYNQFGATPPIGSAGGGVCQTGCTTDADCSGALQCFQRSGGGGLQPVPGCENNGIENIPDDTNVCYDATSLDTNLGFSSVCAVSNSYNYLIDVDCQCTEHDEDYDCKTRTARSTQGECIDGVLLGAALTEDDPFFNTDKIEECRNRCLLRDENTKAFYVKNDWTCGCATGYCKLGADLTYQAYDITLPFGQSCDEKDGFLFTIEEGLYTEPFVKTVLLEDRPPNPLTCNVESYLHIGTIMDSGECECPLYDFELMHADTQEYTELGLSYYKSSWVDRFMHYPQLQRLLESQLSDITLAECKQACDEFPDCTEITHDGTAGATECWAMITSEYFYDNIQVRDWEYIKSSDRYCNTVLMDSMGIDPSDYGTIEGCFQEFADLTFHNGMRTPIINWGQTSTTAYPCRISSISRGPWGYMDQDFDPRHDYGIYDEQTFSNHHYCTSDQTPTDVRTSLSPFGETSGVVRGDKTPTWVLTMEGAYFTHATKIRYKKQKSNDEINLYCPVGEVPKYSLLESHSHANPHYCMQECRKELLGTPGTEILSRGDLLDGNFTCYCSLTISGTCTLQGPSSFPQYKVHKNSGPLTSSERLLSPRDPQVGNTQQCKCQGYYIYKGEAFSCPQNTFKNSGHCNSACTKCPLGKFSAVGSTLCEKCPAGRVLTDDKCAKCEVGKYASAVDTECQTCTRGRYNMKVGQPMCTGCPAGWFDDDDSEGINCDMCTIGKSTNDQIGMGGCLDCPQGFYNNEIGLSVCKGCALGRYGNQMGQTVSTSCKPCSAGYYQDTTGKNNCKGCPEGRYSDLTARHACSKCKAGKLSPGTQAYDIMTNCYDCNPGKYGDEDGQTSCKNCDPGKYSDQFGQKSCKKCVTGQFTSDSGGASCETCAYGKYAGGSSNNACTDCPSAKPSSSYAVGSWGYSFDNPSHTRADTTCDSTIADWSEEPAILKRREYEKNSNNEYVWDCKYLMSVNRDYGVWSRRPCWTGFSNNCNTIACSWWNDCSNVWTLSKRIASGGEWRWCYPGGSIDPLSGVSWKYWNRPDHNNDKGYGAWDS